MNKSLYTPDDIKKERLRLYKKQLKFDPVLNRAIDFGETVCDHDHITQHTRGALHRQTNSFEGLVFNAYRRCLEWVSDVPLPDVLRNLADYLEQDFSDNPYHTGWMKRVKIDFGKLPAKQQDLVLASLGCTISCTNATARKKELGKLLKDRNLGYNAIKEAINKVIPKS